MSDATPLHRVFGRAFLQVTLVAWNVVNVSDRQFVLAFFTGTAVSWVWWMNSRAAAHSEQPSARAAYALGAGTGTVAGMIVGGWL